jgi:hypothetical protein
LKTPSIVSMRSQEISEICSKPSFHGKNSTKAPNA